MDSGLVGAILTILGSGAVAAAVTHILSARTRREERDYAAKLRDEQEKRDRRQLEENERRTRLASLRAVWTELSINDAICRAWEHEIRFYLIGSPEDVDKISPIVEFEQQSFNSAREPLSSLPHNVRYSVFRAYSETRSFDTMTRGFSALENPDLDALLAKSTVAASAITYAINLLSAHLMGDTLWEEQLLGDSELSDSEPGEKSPD